MLVKILIVFFALLLAYQLSLAFFDLKEGFQTANLEYQNYDDSDPMILSQQNAGNIEYLKQQIDSLLALKKEVKDTSENVEQLNSQILTLTQQQQLAATQLVGSEPVKISGIETSSAVDDMTPF